MTLNYDTGLTIGINPGPGLPGSPYPYWTKLFADMNTLGCGWLRFQLSWDKIENPQGTYNWTITDDAVAQCNANSIKIELTLRGAPPWALTTASQKGSTEPWFLPDATLFAGFATQMMTRYDGTHGHGAIDAIGCNEDWNIKNTKVTDVFALNQTVSPSHSYTSIKITAAAQGAGAGSQIYFSTLTNPNIATLSADVNPGDTAMSVNSFTPSATFNAGDNLKVAYVAGHSSTYSLYDAGSKGSTGLAKAQPSRNPLYGANAFNAYAPAIRAISPTIPMGVPLVWWPEPMNPKIYPGSPSNYTAFFTTLYTLCEANIIGDPNVFLDFHYYSNQTNNAVGSTFCSTIQQAVADIKAVSVAFGDSGRAIWNTEFGWQVPQDTDAASQAKQYQNQLNAMTPGVNGNKAFFFTLDYSPGGGTGSSLVVPDGHGGFTRQPAYTTLQNFNSQQLNSTLTLQWM